MIEYFEKVTELLKNGTGFVSVTLVDSLGSTPQDQGSKMLVTASGLYYGTVGGGKVEKKSIEEALNLLNRKDDFKKSFFAQWNLNKDVGMTCGGTVRLYFEVFNQNTWEITVFGAGHISQALIPLLLTLECHVTCIDQREEWLNKLPESPKLTLVQSKDMPSEVKNIRENAFVVLMTMGHTTDKPILLEILKTREFPYIGVIGSKAKANILARDILEAGLPEEYKKRYYCPMGLDLGSNNVNEIAISITAQLLQQRDL
jgi:xanthine dehydrogenase accessory factor